MLHCLVLLAGFCFSGSHLHMEMNNFGLGYTVAVTAPAYKAEFAGTDVILMHDFRKSPKACAEGTCARYFKFCSDTDGGGVRCAYRLTWAGLIADGGIEIAADSRDALLTAEREIQLVASPGDRPVKIPLSLMTVTAPGAEPPACPSELQAAACNPA